MKAKTSRKGDLTALIRASAVAFEYADNIDLVARMEIGVNILKWKLGYQEVDRRKMKMIDNDISMSRMKKYKTIREMIERREI